MALTKEGCAMPKKSKKYIVRLSDAERQTLQHVIGKFKGSSQKVRRAQVLLKTDADGPDWTDAKIAEAFGCQTQTVENIRERLVTRGFEVTLNGQPRLKAPREKVLDGEQEAKLIAMRLGSPPPGFSNWTTAAPEPPGFNAWKTTGHEKKRAGSRLPAT
jgi:Homeodomain-like domain